MVSARRVLPIVLATVLAACAFGWIARERLPLVAKARILEEIASLEREALVPAGLPDPEPSHAVAFAPTDAEATAIEELLDVAEACEGEPSRESIRLAGACRERASSWLESVRARLSGDEPRLCRSHEVSPLLVLASAGVELERARANAPLAWSGLLDWARVTRTLASDSLLTRRRRRAETRRIVHAVERLLALAPPSEATRRELARELERLEDQEGFVRAIQGSLASARDGLDGALDGWRAQGLVDALLGPGPALLRTADDVTKLCHGARAAANDERDLEDVAARLWEDASFPWGLDFWAELHARARCRMARVALALSEEPSRTIALADPFAPDRSLRVVHGARGPSILSSGTDVPANDQGPYRLSFELPGPR